jgi:hypothetical protein
VKSNSVRRQPSARPVRAVRRRPKPRRRRRALWVRLLELLLIALIAAGGYLAIDALLRNRSERQARIADGDDAVISDAQPPLDEWQRQGPGGWLRLFDEACKGMPGYQVDVGLPARLKLAELGAQVRPLMLEKLNSPEYAERICAIQVLAAIGEPSPRVVELLARELRRATLRRHEIGVLKCATTVPAAEGVLVRVSVLALGSTHPRTRRLAAYNACGLRHHPSAPANVAQRLLALLDDPDAATRFLVASLLAKEGAPRTYQVLLDGLDSPDRDTCLTAAYCVAKLRGIPHTVPWNATKHEFEKALDDHRRWLRKQLH